MNVRYRSAIVRGGTAFARRIERLSFGTRSVSFSGHVTRSYGSTMLVERSDSVSRSSSIVRSFVFPIGRTIRSIMCSKTFYHALQRM